MKGLKPGWAVKALVVALLLRCFSAAATATNHSVGGALGWDLVSDLQEWASQATFHVGDSLVFSYTPVHDVLEVNATDYGICHTVNPLEAYKDGETVIPLMEEGDRYFMCGRLGLKLHVHVLPQLMIDSSATSSAPGPSPTASGSNKGSNGQSPPHGTLLETFAIACLGLCTLGAIVHPVYSSGTVLMHGMDLDRHRVSEYIVALLTTSVWLYYDFLLGHFWVILAFKCLTVTVEICSLIILLIHVESVENLKLYCLGVALFNISIPLNLLQTTSVPIWGSCGVICNMLVYIWPVYTMKRVIELKKCNDEISMGNAVLCLLNGLLWILYSYLMGDKYVAIPNVVQVCVATAQLVILHIYGEGASSLLEPLIGASEG